MVPSLHLLCTRGFQLLLLFSPWTVAIFHSMVTTHAPLVLENNIAANSEKNCEYYCIVREIAP